VVEEVLGSLDFIIAVPVFGPGVDPSTGGTPLAWVAASVGEFDGVLERPFAGTGGSIGADLTAHIEDARPAAEGVSRVADSPSPRGPLAGVRFVRTDRFEAAGLELSLRTRSARDADAEAREVLVYTLILGLIASVLGAAVVYLRGRSLTREGWL